MVSLRLDACIVCRVSFDVADDLSAAFLGLPRLARRAPVVCTHCASLGATLIGEKPPRAPRRRPLRKEEM